MAATNADVLDGIETAVSAGCPGVRFYRLPPQDVVPPAVLLTGFTFEPHIQFGATARKFNVELTAVVSARQVQFFDELLRLVEPSDTRSVQHAIEVDPTLGNRVGDLRMASTSDLREITIAESAYWAMSVTFEVWG